MIHIGTSGFSYQDWKGFFYPKSILNSEMLGFYSNFFSTCEINSSYYRIPTPKTTQQMVKKSCSKINFVIKAHQNMTHTRLATANDYQRFNEALKPMQDAGVLAAILIQFPFSFSNNLENRGYLADLKNKLLNRVDVVVEFRHKSWFQIQIRNFLKSINLGFVNVDEPILHGLMPPSDWVSNTIGYIRFHGRNHEKWFGENKQAWERYNYLYSENELLEWLPRIKTISQQTKDLYILFNNHWQSQAITNANQLMKIIANGINS